MGFIPFLPRFVVTRTTPLAALEPYIAVADASLRISIVSTSVRFRLYNVLEIFPDVPAEYSGTPSITHNGCESPDKDDDPRIITDTGEVGEAELIITFTPGARPCNIDWIEAPIGAVSISFFPKRETAPVMSLAFVVP